MSLSIETVSNNLFNHLNVERKKEEKEEKHGHVNICRAFDAFA